MNPHGLSIWKHLLVVWGGGLVLWTTLTGITAYAVLPSGEAFTVTVMVFIANLLFGWVLALIAFVLHLGVRGWIDAITHLRQERAGVPMATGEVVPAQPEQTQEAEQTGQPESTEEMLAKWAQINTYGCCLTHLDAEGYPSHGGPGCVHPAMTGQR